MGDAAMLERRLLSARIDFVMLNFSFEFHAVLWYFDKRKSLMLMLLVRKSSVRCVCFPLSKKVFELDFSARDEA